VQVILIEGTIEIPGAGKCVDQYVDDVTDCVIEAIDERGWKFAGVLRPVDAKEDDPDICISTESKTPTTTADHDATA
jgi:hypothetical protein